ncbi:MAG: hypothetical protein ACTSRG_03410 [Candidatus Helarchaeota archaeon]
MKKRKSYKLIHSDWVKIEILKIMEKNKEITPNKLSYSLPKYKNRSVSHRTVKQNLIFFEHLGIVSKNLITLSDKQKLEQYFLTELGQQITKKIKENANSQNVK